MREANLATGLHPSDRNATRYSECSVTDACCRFVDSATQRYCHSLLASIVLVARHYAGLQL